MEVGVKAIVGRSCAEAPIAKCEPFLCARPTLAFSTKVCENARGMPRVGATIAIAAFEFNGEGFQRCLLCYGTG